MTHREHSTNVVANNKSRYRSLDYVKLRLVDPPTPALAPSTRLVLWGTKTESVYKLKNECVGDKGTRRKMLNENKSRKDRSKERKKRDSLRKISLKQTQE